jgi:hypothetical protein
MKIYIVVEYSGYDRTDIVVAFKTLKAALNFIQSHKGEDYDWEEVELKE